MPDSTSTPNEQLAPGARPSGRAWPIAFAVVVVLLLAAACDQLTGVPRA